MPYIVLLFARIPRSCRDRAEVCGNSKWTKNRLLGQVTQKLVAIPKTRRAATVRHACGTRGRCLGLVLGWIRERETDGGSAPRDLRYRRRLPLGLQTRESEARELDELCTHDCEDLEERSLGITRNDSRRQPALVLQLLRNTFWRVTKGCQWVLA